MMNTEACFRYWLLRRHIAGNMSAVAIATVRSLKHQHHLRVGFNAGHAS